jgi:hypothetical protein
MNHSHQPARRKTEIIPNTRRLLATLQPVVLCALTALFASGCASPQFQPVAHVPPGRGVVYVYVPPEAPAQGVVMHNDGKLGGLGPNQYFAHFPESGTNIYAMRVGFRERGGLVGLLLTHQDQDATRIRIEAGKSYFVRLIGIGANASLWRVDESTALAEIQQCHIIQVEKAKRVATETVRASTDRSSSP